MLKAYCTYTLLGTVYFIMRRLTGKYRIRKTLFGWQIKVEVYETVCDFVGDESPDVKVWRKARVEDLIELGINCA